MDSQKETTLVIPAYGRQSTDTGVTIQNDSNNDVMATCRAVFCIDVDATEVGRKTEVIRPLPGVDPEDIINEKEQQIQDQKHKMEQQKQQINDQKKQIYGLRQELEELRKSCLVSGKRHNEVKQMIFKYHKIFTSEVVQLFPELSKRKMEPSSILPPKKRSRATSASQVKATSVKPKAIPKVVSTAPQAETEQIKSSIEMCLLKIQKFRSRFQSLSVKTRFFGPVF